MFIIKFLYSYLTFGGWFERKARKILLDLDNEIEKIENGEKTPFRTREIQHIKEEINEMIKYKFSGKYEPGYWRHLLDCGDFDHPLTNKLMGLYHFYIYLLWF